MTASFAQPGISGLWAILTVAKATRRKRQSLWRLPSLPFPSTRRRNNIDFDSSCRNILGNLVRNDTKL